MKRSNLVGNLIIAGLALVAGLMGIGLISLILQPPPPQQAIPTAAVLSLPTLLPSETPGPPTLVTTTPIPGQPTTAPTPLPSLAAPTIPEVLLAASSPRALYIPRLGLEAATPIINLPIRNRTWDVRELGQSAGFLEGTAPFGAGGNTVLAAHIQLSAREMGPFLRLNQLRPGDQVIVRDGDRFYRYEVSETEIVAASDVEVTFPTETETLTLLTCTSWNSQQGVFAERLIVRAKPVIPSET